MTPLVCPPRSSLRLGPFGQRGPDQCGCLAAKIAGIAALSVWGVEQWPLGATEESQRRYEGIYAALTGCVTNVLGLEKHLRFIEREPAFTEADNNLAYAALARAVEKYNAEVGK